MSKNKCWRLKATGVDGNVYLFGVNIFEYEWINTQKRVQVTDLSHDIPVYQVEIKNVKYEFAAIEVSNCVWKFYVRRNWFYKLFAFR